MPIWPPDVRRRGRVCGWLPYLDFLPAASTEPSYDERRANESASCFCTHDTTPSCCPGPGS